MKFSLTFENAPAFAFLHAPACRHDAAVKKGAHVEVEATSATHAMARYTAEHAISVKRYSCAKRLA